ncbi:MAG: prenyltransferase [Gemmatimonadetes bacterium]|nr:prenyltransferase [Gemmatimonadota bacterium]NIO30242.1 prenyltransferase [Gemmatimonadota bacterium]
MSVSAIAGVARAPFLLLPVTLVAAGTGSAAYVGQHDWASALLALLGMLGVHVAVNALNEASDYRTRIDFHTERTPFSGGSGTLPAERLSYGKAVATGLAGGMIGIAVGVYFLTIVGAKLIPILAVGALATFFYSVFLARAYVGELFAGLGLGALPVIGTTMVQTGDYEAVAIAASLPAFFMTFNLLLLNEFPDETADRKGGRRNLVLLLGRPKAAVLYASFAILVPVSLIAAVALDYLPTLALAAIVPSLILLPKPLGWAFKKPRQPVPIPALGANVIWNLSTNTLLALALFF